MPQISYNICMIQLNRMKVKYHDTSTGLVRLAGVGGEINKKMPDEIDGVVLSSSFANALTPSEVVVLSPGDIVMCLVEEAGNSGRVNEPVYIIGSAPLTNSMGRDGSMRTLAMPAKSGEKYQFGPGGTFMAWLKRIVKVFVHPWTFYEMSAGKQQLTALFSRLLVKTRAGWVRSKWDRDTEETSVEIEINAREQNPIYDDFHIENHDEVENTDESGYVNKSTMRFKGSYAAVERRSAENGSLVPNTSFKSREGREIDNVGPLTENNWVQERDGTVKKADLRVLDNGTGEMAVLQINDVVSLIVDGNNHIIVQNAENRVEMTDGEFKITRNDGNSIVCDTGGIVVTDANENSAIMADSGILVEDKTGNYIEMAAGGIKIHALGTIKLGGGNLEAIAACGPSILPVCPFTGAPHVSATVTSSP